MKRYYDPKQFGVFAPVPLWLCRIPVSELSFGAKMVYARLGFFSNNGIAFPRQDSLSKELGISSRQVRRLIAELEEYGLLEVVQRGKNISNVYRFVYLDVISGVDTYEEGDRTYMSALDRTDVSTPDRTDVSAPIIKEHSNNNTLQEHPTENPLEAAWAEFLFTYPKRIGGLDAKKGKAKFMALAKRKATLDAIMAGVKGFRESMDELGKTGTEYIPMIPTWLNRERWLEYQPQPKEDLPPVEVRPEWVKGLMA